MTLNHYDIQAPMFLRGEMSEAEVPGASVSSQHCLPTVLLPVVKRQQYMLVSQKLTPLFLSAGCGWMKPPGGVI
ncbi:hypothetical protein ACFFJN_01765 [Erwinia mallotivora]|uniref:hypothetical protein n=1 Tax=Erwinia mallotivora TaxID=69222 RepID=UPI0035EAC4E7